MLTDSFIFKNVRAKAKGIELQAPLSISAAYPKVERQIIPGRNGTLIDHDGTFENRTIMARCYLLDMALESRIDDINAWLFGQGGYHRFEDTQDEKHFMLARASRGIDKYAKMGRINSFYLEFDAKPQRFLKLGEKAIDVTRTKSIYNPTAFPALPLIEIAGSGDITVEIFGSKLYIYGLDGAITYDAETDEAYRGASNLNHKIGTTDALTIPSGQNTITVTGNVSSIKITPRWWEI
jgi:phage-related protein